MAPKKSTEQVIADGLKAHAIITDPVFCQATDALEAQWVQQWRAEKDAAKRDRFWHLIEALGGVKEALGVIRQNGELAEMSTKRISRL